MYVAPVSVLFFCFLFFKSKSRGGHKLCRPSAKQAALPRCGGTGRVDAVGHKVAAAVDPPVHPPAVQTSL